MLKNWMKKPIHNNPVPAEREGSIPEMVFVGMCPGEAEARAMRPFVGPSGKLLRKIIRNLNIEGCYITNVVKIPYYNAPPKEKIEEWAPYCAQEILAYSLPTVLLGQVAADVFLPKNPMYARRGNISCFKQIPFTATWHPSYALRPGNPRAIQEMQSDIAKLREFDCTHLCTVLKQQSDGQRSQENGEPKKCVRCNYRINEDISENNHQTGRSHLSRLHQSVYTCVQQGEQEERKIPEPTVFGFRSFLQKPRMGKTKGDNDN